VLIQDADDEYDIDDYDALLEPLRLYQHAFVLGSRHKGHWRMRQFGGQKSLTAFMNVGHILLTEFFNALYGQSLSDPWTMYKVFRRDCLARRTPGMQPVRLRRRARGQARTLRLHAI